MIGWLLSLFRRRKPQAVIVRSWRTCDSAKRRISTPGHFGSWEAALEFADRLQATMLEGRMSRGWYRNRLRRICKLYEHECRYRREAVK